MDKFTDTHPLYRIAAVLVVGSVAKALFAPPRLYSPVVSNVAATATDVVAEKLKDVSVGKHG